MPKYESVVPQTDQELGGCVLGEYHPPPSPPTPGKEEGIPARRGSDGKLRGRKRVSDPAPPLDSDIEVNTRSQL